jgi:hypothetical protein
VTWTPTEDDTVTATGLSGTAFTDIDLSDLEWSDYDEKDNVTVGIYSLQYKFQTL